MTLMYRCFVLCKSKCLKNGNLYFAAKRLSTAITDRGNASLSDIQSKASYQPVADFYAGKSVFLTGATGFVGRVLIERLLSTCKDIEKVYVLIRQKKELGIQQRLQEMWQCPVFTNLKETKPQVIDKIVPIAGDISEPRLGISSEDEKTLTDEVSVVFHSAAQVMFLTPMKEHLKVNYEGTKKVLDFSKKMKKLDILVHVSTAFTNENSVVEERTYLAPRKIEDVYHILEKYGDDSKQVRGLLDKNGNSYVLSKKMAEAYIAENHGDVPAIIVRPSMITAVYKSPLAGYTDSWVTCTGLFCDVASGLTRVLYGSDQCVVDVIPVDYVCNFLIIAAAKNSRTNQLNVYNISTSYSNPINWKQSIELFLKESKNQNYAEMPLPTIYFTRRAWTIPVLVLIWQIIPSYLADIWLRLGGKKPRYMDLQSRVITRSKYYKPTTDTSWLFKSARAQHLISTLDENDRRTYPCDPGTISWYEYIPIYCRGVKKYMLRDKNKK